MEYKRLPDSELEVMMAVWRSQCPADIGEIQSKLQSEKPRPYQAVQTLLSRLVEKGFLQCEKTGRLNYYAPLVEEEAYRQQETHSFIDKLYGSSPVRLIASLVEGQQLSEAELNEIRRLLKGDA